MVDFIDIFCGQLHQSELSIHTGAVIFTSTQFCATQSASAAERPEVSQLLVVRTTVRHQTTVETKGANHHALL